MKHSIFVIFDSKAVAYFPPLFLPREEMAVRAFGDCINDVKHNFHAHPEDYTLFSIGSFDDETAALDCFAPKSLCNGIVLVREDGLVLRDDFIEPDVQASLRKLDGEDHA